MKCTGSISRGKTAEKHNTRECYHDLEHTPENIDRGKIADNVVLVDRSLEDVYAERFAAAMEEYNAKQREKKHPERQIHDYLEHVRQDKKLQPMYEFVVQVGNMDEHPYAETAKTVYSEWLDSFTEKFGGNFAVKQAIVHMDEKVPHMHVELVPCAESRRGLAVQNSMNKAVKQAGFDDYKAMLAGWDEVLTECMERHGLERVAGDREKQMGGVDINTYRRSMAVKRDTEAAQERLECLQREADAVQSAKEPVAQSVRTLVAGLGDEEREKTLAGEIDGLRSRISELEGENQRARDRAGELEAGNSGLRDELVRVRGRYQQLEQRFRVLERGVREVIERLREVPNAVSEWAQDIARELGKRVYDPVSPERLWDAAHEAAAMSVQRRVSRGIERDKGMSL